MDKKNTPEVKLGQYKGLAVTRHVRPVTDKTVDIELVHQARMHAVYHPTTEPAKRKSSSGPSINVNGVFSS